MALTVDGTDGARIAFGRFDGRIASTIAGVAVLSVMAGGAGVALGRGRIAASVVSTAVSVAAAVL